MTNSMLNYRCVRPYCPRVKYDQYHKEVTSDNNRYKIDYTFCPHLSTICYENSGRTCCGGSYSESRTAAYAPCCRSPSPCEPCCRPPSPCKPSCRPPSPCKPSCPRISSRDISPCTPKSSPCASKIGPIKRKSRDKSNLGRASRCKSVGNQSEKPCNKKSVSTNCPPCQSQQRLCKPSCPLIELLNKQTTCESKTENRKCRSRSTSPNDCQPCRDKSRSVSPFEEFGQKLVDIEKNSCVEAFSECAENNEYQANGDSITKTDINGLSQKIDWLTETVMALTAKVERIENSQKDVNEMKCKILVIEEKMRRSEEESGNWIIELKEAPKTNKKINDLVASAYPTDCYCK